MKQGSTRKTKEGGIMSIRNVSRLIASLSTIAILSACTTNHSGFLLSTPLPEYIYRQPLRNYYTHGEMGIFVFGSPLYAPSVGNTAANTIHQLLVEQMVFRKITPLYQYGNIPIERQLAIAREHGFDLMMSGNVLYYMDGSLTQAARVEMEATVFDVPTGTPVWKMVTAETGKPKAEFDFFLFQTPGKPAPAAITLITRNAEKMVHLLQSESSTFQSLPEDMKLVDKGYQYLAKGDYEKARPFFISAIDKTADNAHAIYNLGFVNEMTGNTAAAVDCYQRVVILNPETTVPELIHNGSLGLSLSTLAKKRLEALK